jgi:hypothetical protein
MKPVLKNCLVCLAGSLLLLLPAIYNGYPVVYSDTSTYLESGFLLETPFDRPITYGLYTWLSSLNGWSLWTVIIGQAFLISWLIQQFAGFLNAGIKQGYILLVFFTLATFTSLPWTVCQLMPDIFTPVMMLSASLLLFAPHKPVKKFALFFVFTLATSMHMSHIPINILFLLLLVGLKWIPGTKIHLGAVRFVNIGILFILTLLSVLTMGSALSKSRHAFFMGAMVEHGITQAYLEKHCGEKQFLFCNYKDSLHMRAYEFLWNETSPFYKMGGFKGTREEFNKIIAGTFTEPEFIGIHISESVKATLHQCTLFGIGDGNGPFGEGTELANRVKKFVPSEYEAYLLSVQSQAQLEFVRGWNYLIYATLICAVLVIIFIAIIFSRRRIQFPVVILVMLLYIFLNMWSSGTFANAIDRLGSKVIWLIPLLAILLLIKGREKKPLSAAQITTG